jgi:hypothetical protein
MRRDTGFLSTPTLNVLSVEPMPVILPVTNCRDGSSKENNLNLRLEEPLLIANIAGI